MLYVRLGLGLWYLKFIKFGEFFERERKLNSMYKVR